MSNTVQTTGLVPAPGEILLTLLETLPGALFVVDDAATILYANASARTLTGAIPEEVCGKPLWRGAPQLVSTALYQAVHKTRQTRIPAEVQYVSPVTGHWLHVQLVPTADGLLLHVHQKREPLPGQQTVFPNNHRATDILKDLSAWVAVLTPEGIVLEINDVPLANAQIRCEQVIGLPFAQTPWWTFHPASQEQLRAAITAASSGETGRFETLVHLREGGDLHLEATITPQRDVDHHVCSLVYVGTDITARKRAEAEIRALVDALPQIVWMAGPDGSITYSNQRLTDSLAMTPKQVEGNGWLAGVHPDDWQRVWETWQTSVQTGVPYEVEHRLRDGASGAYRWFLVRGTPQRNAQGTILYWVGTCTDIRRQKQAEQQLKESEANWRVLAETVPQLVWIERADGYVEYVNQRYLDYVQVRLEHLQNAGWTHFLHVDDFQRTLAAWRHACDSGEPYEIEYRLKHGRTGAYRWFLVRALPVCDKTGQITKWFGTCTDIEDQKRTEEALHQSQARIRALINSNMIGIVSTEEEVIVEANDAWLHMTGYTQEDLARRTLTRPGITPPEDAPLFERARQEGAVHGQHTPFETEVVCKDGSRLPVLFGGVLFQEQPRKVVAFVLDNSARKELEQRKDSFISMASHELRTPLTALKMQTQLTRKRLERQSHHEAATALSRIEVPIEQLERLTAELLDVSKIQTGRLEYRLESVDLDALLREIAETMQQNHPSHRIVVRGTGETSLRGDRDRLGQVFTNLLSNAIKYSPDAQTVELDLCASEETITIRVHDHGLGIPREQCDRIFERFYRVTDAKQKAVPGLGMGLYIVAEIVKHYGGTITVDSDVGKGSTLAVILPKKRDA